jgi:tRNA threonylcarbamoyl adenosine modification protein (Sua5/YciO/YrdC/YwlC family)
VADFWMVSGDDVDNPSQLGLGPFGLGFFLAHSGLSHRILADRGSAHKPRDTAQHWPHPHLADRRWPGLIMGDHLYTFTNPPNPKHLVLAMPAGTSWMLCCAANSKKANQKIRLLKPHREKDKPFSVVCDSISMASEVAAIDGQAFRLLNRICPGPFTVLLRSSRLLPKLLKNKRLVVGIRIPDEPIILEIVRQFGKPLLATSMPTGHNGTAMTMGYAIYEAFGDGIDLVVDVGEELSGESSTILDMTNGELEVIRQGAGDLALV